MSLGKIYNKLSENDKNVHTSHIGWDLNYALEMS